MQRLGFVGCPRLVREAEQVIRCGARQRTASRPVSGGCSERPGVVSVRVPSRSPSESAPGTRGRVCFPSGRAVALSCQEGKRFKCDDGEWKSKDERCTTDKADTHTHEVINKKTEKETEESD